MSNGSERRAVPSGKGYSEAGASTTRRALKSFKARSGAPREDIDSNNCTLRQRGRLLYMSSPLATSAINTNRTKVVGTGLLLKCEVNREALGLSPEAAKAWEQTTEAEFKLWSGKRENFDALSVNNFFAQQQLALKAWLMSGDCFPLFKRYEATPTCPYTLRVHLIEADRVSTPTKFATVPSINATEGKNSGTGNKIYDGVEVDAQGKIVAYHIRNSYPFQVSGDPVEWQRVEAFGKRTGLPNILHVMESERPEQYRGITYLAQVIEPLLQLRRYTESELMGALVQSFFTAWIKTNTDPTEIPVNEIGADGMDGIPGDEPDSVSEDENEYEMGPGSVLHLEENEDVVFGNPNIPTSGFETFTRTVAKLVGAALEIPFDVLIKEFNASYTASKAALLEAWDAFKMRRSWFVDDYCQPIYEVWLAEAVAIGRIKAPGFFNDPRIRAAWCGARWIGPVAGSLDPMKEIKADILAVERAFKTHEQVTTERGSGDWKENVEQLTRENALLEAAGGARTKVAVESTEKGNPDEGGRESDE